MHSFLFPAAALLASLAYPTIASAATAYSTADVNMRVGPGTEYPVITTIYAGEPVTIYGCLSDWSWCDTEWYGDRGWVRGAYLDVVYESRHVYLPDYAPLIGLTVIVFEFNNYWDVHYHDRPWYRDRDRWRNHWRMHDRHAHFRDRRETRREERLETREERRFDDVRRDRREDRPDVRRDRREDRVEVRRDRRSDREVRRGGGDDRPAVRRDRRSDREVRRGDGGDRPAARRDRREDRLRVQRDRSEVRRDRRQVREGARGGRRGGDRCPRPGRCR